MTRRLLPWVAGIAVLFGLAIWLMSIGDAPPPPAPPAVVFPDRMRMPDRMRAATRRKLPAPAVAAPLPSPRPRDPLLAALPRKGSAIVLEANALRQSPAGELLVKCLSADDPHLFDEMKDKLGVDLLKDVDRIALDEGGAVVTGQFGGAHWSEIVHDNPGQSYGDQGVLYPVAGDGGTGTVARWGDQLLAFGANAGAAEQLIDRVEGREEEGTPLLGEDQTYGDAYGVLGGSWLSGLVQAVLTTPDQAPLEGRLLQAASSVELHLDAQSDLDLAATFHGTDPGAVDDLGRALGGALSLWRLAASAKGENELSTLLDQAKIVPGDGSFTLDLAVPLSLVREALSDCGKKKR